jgi:hypothetical protein
VTCKFLTTEVVFHIGMYMYNAGNPEKAQEGQHYMGYL